MHWNIGALNQKPFIKARSPGMQELMNIRAWMGVGALTGRPRLPCSCDLPMGIRPGPSELSPLRGQALLTLRENVHTRAWEGSSHKGVNYLMEKGPPQGKLMVLNTTVIRAMALSPNPWDTPCTHWQLSPERPTKELCEVGWVNHFIKLLPDRSGLSGFDKT